MTDPLVNTFHFNLVHDNKTILQRKHHINVHIMNIPPKVVTRTKLLVFNFQSNPMQERKYTLISEPCFSYINIHNPIKGINRTEPSTKKNNSRPM